MGRHPTPHSLHDYVVPQCYAGCSPTPCTSTLRSGPMLRVKIYKGDATVPPLPEEAAGRYRTLFKRGWVVVTYGYEFIPYMEDSLFAPIFSFNLAEQMRYGNCPPIDEWEASEEQIAEMLDELKRSKIRVMLGDHAGHRSSQRRKGKGFA